jgi:2-keto-4-pentenoate hydratase/2-oxohepta-3-ene-1,7-dioic acid hydratase in catechol pathway
MRLVTFIQDNTTKVGAMLGTQYVVDLNNGHTRLLKSQGEKPDHPFAVDIRSFLEQGESSLTMARKIVAFAGDQIKAGKDEMLTDWILSLADIRLTAPIPDPSKVVAIGQNYRDHCAEQGVKPPDRPIIFAKFPTSVVGPGESITWDPELTVQVDYEAELGVVIGKKARNISQEKAFEYVVGYLNGNDVSARDLQFGDRQWVRGKSLDTFCPIGPYLVTKDEAPDPHNLSIRAVLNGNVMQDSNTSNLIFTIPYLVEFITKAFTLLPGDIILTGTPPGVGVFRDPKVLLKPGDTITIEVEHLGKLTNPVVEWKG